MINKLFLQKTYIAESNSVAEIASKLGCSQNKVTYWLDKYKISRRSISDAVYVKNNPSGDPFSFQKLDTNKKWFLYGLGLGLYWGEGNKANKNSVRLGNTDPYLIKFFLKFLKEIYNIDESKLSFGIQIFSDCSKEESLDFWQTFLHAEKSQFLKVIVTKSNKVGTYRHKNKFGVLTVYFHNTKLRDSIIDAIKTLQKPM